MRRQACGEHSAGRVVIAYLATIAYASTWLVCVHCLVAGLLANDMGCRISMVWWLYVHGELAFGVACLLFGTSAMVLHHCGAPPPPPHTFLALQIASVWMGVWSVMFGLVSLRQCMPSASPPGDDDAASGLVYSFFGLALLNSVVFGACCVTGTTCSSLRRHCCVRVHDARGTPLLSP